MQYWGSPWCCLGWHQWQLLINNLPLWHWWQHKYSPCDHDTSSYNILSPFDINGKGLLPLAHNHLVDLHTLPLPLTHNHPADLYTLPLPLYILNKENLMRTWENPKLMVKIFQCFTSTLMIITTSCPICMNNKIVTLGIPQAIFCCSF